MALAIARPLAGERQRAATDEPTANAQRVVLVDVSQSMAAEKGAVRIFERARAIAARQLVDRSGLQANLILAGATPQSVFDRTSSNFAALRDALSEAAVLPERLNVQAALNRAAEMLARPGEGPEVRRELIVVSDFQ
ncbi:MAG TPA: VWA domain-containing protein, partial [Thermomicrobiales bacterium]|nr:VWA domain-containing protein [Thermomicrobiales bacterium]